LFVPSARCRQFDFTAIQRLISDFVVAHPDVETLVLLMRPSNAVALARATGSQTLGLTGGTL
jgi:hypothetical protein